MRCSLFAFAILSLAMWSSSAARQVRSHSAADTAGNDTTAHLAGNHTTAHLAGNHTTAHLAGNHTTAHRTSSEAGSNSSTSHHRVVRSSVGHNGTGHNTSSSASASSESAESHHSKRHSKVVKYGAKTPNTTSHSKLGHKVTNNTCASCDCNWNTNCDWCDWCFDRHTKNYKNSALTSRVSAKAMSTCTVTISVTVDDTCCSLAASHNLSLSEFLLLNPGIDCGNIGVGASPILCVANRDWMCAMGMFLVCQSNGSLIYDNATGILTLTKSHPVKHSVGKAGRSTNAVCNQTIPVHSNDTCCSLAASHNLPLTQFLAFNPSINCSSLGPTVCVDMTAAHARDNCGGNCDCYYNSNCAWCTWCFNSPVSYNNTQTSPPGCAACDCNSNSSPCPWCTWC